MQTKFRSARRAHLARRAVLLVLMMVTTVAAMVGCGRPALSTHNTENPSIPYEMLFSRSGCEVGRFYDYGRPVYVTICPKTGLSASQSSWVEDCGKDCTKVVDRYQVQIRGEREDAGDLSAARVSAARAP